MPHDDGLLLDDTTVSSLQEEGLDNVPKDHLPKSCIILVNSSSLEQCGMREDQLSSASDISVI